jgi:hypothetical protein
VSTGGRRLWAAAPILSALTTSAGCRPALDDRPWLITSPQILGWEADPPEATPGNSVTLRVIALDPARAIDTAATSWTLCRAPKPLVENRVVAASCLIPAAVADAAGDPVQLRIPTDACQVFGPDTPQPLPGAPATRPRDPDASGGYYQPVTMALGAALAVGLERVTCDLPDASLAASRAFQAAYHPNQNPAITGLTFNIGGAPVDPAAIPPGARVTVEAGWVPGAAEPFPIFDRGTGTVVSSREELLASWFVTGGELSQPNAAITDPGVLSTATDWIAPKLPSAFELVFILRDSRGGSDAASATLSLAPAP